MHTSSYDDVVFHHNGDYSGEVHVVLNSEAADVHYFPATSVNEERIEVKILFSALRKLVLEAIRNEYISKLEDADYEQLAKIFFYTESNLGNVMLRMAKTNSNTVQE